MQYLKHNVKYYKYVAQCAFCEIKNLCKTEVKLYWCPKANNFEPYLTSLLHTLNKAWDTANYEKETVPIIAAIDENENSNQIKGKIYAY